MFQTTWMKHNSFMKYNSFIAYLYKYAFVTWPPLLCQPCYKVAKWQSQSHLWKDAIKLLYFIQVQ